MTPAQLREYVRFCDDPLPGYPPEQRRLAVSLVTHHLARQTPARRLPDILYAHGPPRYARATDEILTL